MSAVRIRVAGGAALHGTVELPPDAAIAQLALVLAALGDGESTIAADLRGSSISTTVRALRMLGVDIADSPAEIRVQGRGLHAFGMAKAAIDCGRSRTAFALLAGVLCGQPFGTRLLLDAVADNRPLDDLIGALRARGAQIAANGREGGSSSGSASTIGTAPALRGGASSDTAPALRGGASLRGPISIAPLLAEESLAGLQCVLTATDADIKGAILLSGLFSAAETAVSEPLLSADHTERMLTSLGVPIRRVGSMAGFDPAQWDGTLRALGRIALPGDTDVAGFIASAASVIPGSRIALRQVGANPTRSGFFDAQRLLGARLLVIAKGDCAGNEPVAEVQVQSGTARGGAMGGEIALRCGDSLPALCLLGTRSVRGLQLQDGEPFAPAGARVWNDLAALVRAFGAECDVQDAGLSVAPAARLNGAHVDAGEDHRLALTAVIFGLAAEGETVVDNATCLAQDRPGLFDALRALGARIEVGA